MNSIIPSSIPSTSNMMENNSNALNLSTTDEEPSTEILLSTTTASTSFEQLAKTAPKTYTISINPTELHNQATKVDNSFLLTTMRPTTYLSTTSASAKPNITSLSSSSSSIPAKLSITSEMPPLLHHFVPKDPSTKLTSSSITMNTTEEQTMSDSPIDEGNATSLLPPLEENKSDNVSRIVKTNTLSSVRTSSLQKLFSSLSMTTESLSLSSKQDKNQITSKIPYFDNSNVSELKNFTVSGSSKDLVPSYSKSEKNETRMHPQLTTLLSPSSTLAPTPSILAPLLNFSAETENISTIENDSSITENSSIFLSGELAIKTTSATQTNDQSKLTTYGISAITNSLLFNNPNPTTKPVDEATAFPLPTTSAPLSQVTNSTIPINKPLLLSRISTVASIITNKNMTVSPTPSPSRMTPLLRTNHSSLAALVNVQTIAQEDFIPTSTPLSESRNLHANISIVMQNATQPPTSTVNMQSTTTVESFSEDPSSKPHSLEKETSWVPSSFSVLSKSTMFIPLVEQNATRSSFSPEKQTTNFFTTGSTKIGTSISPMERSSPSSIISSTTSTTLNSDPLFNSLDYNSNQTSSTPTLIEDASSFIESKENVSKAPTTSKPAISTLSRNKGSPLNKFEQKTFQPFIITPVPEMEAVTTSFETSTISDRTSMKSSILPTKQKITFSIASTSSSLTPIPVPFFSSTDINASITNVLNVTIPDPTSMASFPTTDGETTTLTSSVESRKATTQTQSPTSRFSTSTMIRSTTGSTPLDSKEATTVVTTLGKTTPLITSNEGTDLTELYNPGQQDRMDVERYETTLKTSPTLFPIDQPLSMIFNQKWVPMVAEESKSHFDDTIARIPMSADMVAIQSLNDVQLFQPTVGILSPKESSNTNLQSSKPTSGKELGNSDSSGFIPMIPPPIPQVPQN